MRGVSCVKIGWISGMMFMVYEIHFLYCLGVWWLTVDFEGFDLSTMADSLYDEAIVDVIGPDTIISEPYVIKVCHSLPYLPVIGAKHRRTQGSTLKRDNSPPTQFFIVLQPSRKRYRPQN